MRPKRETHKLPQYTECIDRGYELSINAPPVDVHKWSLFHCCSCERRE